MSNRIEAPTEKLEFLLRRAEQESIAAIRSIDARASERHDAMAHAYSAMAVTMLERSVSAAAEGQADNSLSGCSR